ncbi:MAG: ECF transporter S component [Candidatus Moranbacteria bacterium]|nr:ECF transporter S component [Candidatus Moranbacteria bacterium]
MTFPIAAYQAKDLAWTIGFIVAAVIFPALLAHTPQNQWITGTIVNALLFLAVWRIGIVNATLVAILPSSVALIRGLLPTPMAVLIPYIILSNIILIAIFYALKKYPLAGIISASLAKFLFLLAISTYFIKIASPLLIMMHWPQLFTALAGGLIAVGIIKITKRAE